MLCELQGWRTRMTQATDSRFSMLRGAVALAWVDGQITSEEKARLLDFINGNENLSRDQRAVLHNDMVCKTELSEIWPLITDKLDRAGLIDLAQGLFLQDNEYSDKEKAAYQTIYTQHIASLEASGIESDLRALVKNRQREDMEDSAHYQGSDTVVGKFGKLVWSLERKLGF